MLDTVIALLDVWLPVANLPCCNLYLMSYLNPGYCLYDYDYTPLKKITVVYHLGYSFPFLLINTTWPTPVIKQSYQPCN
jgi:hypothetical protein